MDIQPVTANDIQALSTQQLKAEFKSTYNTIYRYDCFGTSDMVYLDLLGQELYRRGIEVDGEERVIFRKRDEEEED